MSLSDLQESDGERMEICGHPLGMSGQVGVSCKREKGHDGRHKSPFEPQEDVNAEDSKRDAPRPRYEEKCPYCDGHGIIAGLAQHTTPRPSHRKHAWLHNARCDPAAGVLVLSRAIRRIRKRLACLLQGHICGEYGRCLRCGKDLVE